MMSDKLKKPRKLAVKEIARIAREVQGNLAAVESLADAVSRNNDFVDDGRRGVDYSRVNRGGGEGSPTEVAALFSRHDDIGTRMYGLAIELEALLRSSRKARDHAEKLSVVWTKEKHDAASDIANRSNAAGASSQACRNCGRVVAGTPKDSLRKARCEACYRYWSRAGMLVDRPRAYWDRGQCVATLWSEGSERECTLPADHPEDHEWSVEEVPA
jgi:hypothetical protein